MLKVDELKYDDLSLKDEKLFDLRFSLYHSSGCGYLLIRNYIDQDFVAHMRHIWATAVPELTHSPYSGTENFKRSCPNFFHVDSSGNKSFYNFFWNTSLDDATYNACLSAAMLRNRIQGKTISAEIFDFSSRATSYRVVQTRNAVDPVHLHRDWRLDHEVTDYRQAHRLQMTLFLSRHGVDYEGEGLVYHANDGRRISVARDLDIQPGDMLIWRYGNPHSVETIRSTPEQLGFLRILFPPEHVHPEPYGADIGVSEAWFRHMLSVLESSVQTGSPVALWGLGEHFRKLMAASPRLSTLAARGGLALFDRMQAGQRYGNAPIRPPEELRGFQGTVWLLAQAAGTRASMRTEASGLGLPDTAVIDPIP